MMNELHTRIAQGNARIAILGMGYVGFPLAIAAFAAGYDVLAFDIDAKKIASLNAGKSYLRGIDDAQLQAMQKAGRFTATHDAAALNTADVLIMCVPTPLTKHREPDMSYVVATTHTIAQHLRVGQLVVLESTTYPGTTAEIIAPMLEKTGLKIGQDVFLAYSPEREDPGNGMFSTHTIPKVVGADDESSRNLAHALYARIVSEAVTVKNAATAEAVKLTENIFRSVNIALVNELKLVFENMGIDVWEVINAAKTKPFGFMPFYPGPGVGGHCIPIDPFYLTWKSREFGMPTRFIELAGQINERMPAHVIERLRTALDAHQHKGLNGSRILMLGMAYKANVEDIRESPALIIYERLQALGAQMQFHDPYVTEIPPTREHAALAGLKSTSLTAETLQQMDAVLITTAHADMDFALVGQHARLIIDTRNAMETTPVHGVLVKA